MRSATDPTPAPASRRPASRRGMTFGARLRLIFVLVAALVLVVALVAANHAAETAARDRVSEDFHGALSAFHDILAARVRAFDQVVEATVSDQVFRSQLSLTRVSDDALGLGTGGGDDAHPIRDTHDVFASVDLPLFRDYPVLAVLDHQGVLLFSRADRAAYGADLSGLPVVRKALGGAKAVTLWPATAAALRADHVVPAAGTRGLFLVLAEPVTAQGQVLGAMIVGEPLSRIRPQLEMASGALVAVADRRGDAFDLSPDLAGRLPEVERLAGRLAAHPRAEPREVPFGDGPWLAEVAPLKEAGVAIGKALLLKSLDRELGGFRRRLRLAMGAIALLAFLASLVAAALLARRLSAPLVALEDGARRVAGGDLDTHVAVTGADEFARLGEAFNEMTEGLRQRDTIKATFERYMAPAVVEELLAHPDKLELGGETRELTILFSDLVGFTSLSEGRTAAEVVSLLNTYFDAVTAPIVAAGGTLDKFAGDSVMCFFGAPLPQADHRSRALGAALDHLAAVDRLRSEWALRGQPPVDCRIGVNTGEVVVGNIGSSQAQDYTVIGDAVNLASRLEGANKAYGSRLMVTEDALAGCAERFVHRELDLLRVKGKQRGVRVFEVLGRAGSLGPAWDSLLARWAEARAAYLDRRFAEAAAGFDGCLALVPGDGPARVLAARCRAFVAAPPAEGWDGVHVLEVK